MGIDDFGDDPVRQTYKEKTQAILKKLEEEAVNGDETLRPDQIVPHFLHSRLTGALSYQEMGTINNEDARDVIRDTYEAVRRVYVGNQTFRSQITDLKAEFERIYSENDRAENEIGPLSEYIDDFKETPEE